MPKLEIYNPPSEPLQEYEYPLEKISNKWTHQLSGYLTKASESCQSTYQSILQSSQKSLDEIPRLEIPSFIKEIPTEIKEIHNLDEPMLPNMLYVLASGTGTGIMLKKSGLFTRFTMPASAMVLTFYFLYPKTSKNFFEKYIKKFY